MKMPFWPFDELNENWKPVCQAETSPTTTNANTVKYRASKDDDRSSIVRDHIDANNERNETKKKEIFAITGL